MTMLEYLTAELARYYTETDITVTFDDATDYIHAVIDFRNGQSMKLTSTDAAESDSEMYNFFLDEGNELEQLIVTVPLMPEE